MGNYPQKSPEQNIPEEVMLKFMADETKKWTPILQNMQKQRGRNDWSTGYLTSELQSTVEHWNTTMKNQMVDMGKSWNEKYKAKKQPLREENNRLKAKIKELQEELKTRTPNTSFHQPGTHQVMSPSSNVKDKELEHMKETIDRLNQKMASLEQDKESLLLRLSKIAGEKLVANNPDIADLSDPNRPTKIGEKYCELYDNEWTDAYEALVEAGNDEQTAIETLRLTLMNIFSFCEKKADMLVHKAANAVDVLFEEYKSVAGSCREMDRPSHLTIRRKVSPARTNFEDIFLQLRWAPNNTKGGRVNVRANSQVISKQEEIAKVKAEAEGKLISLRKDVALSMVALVQQAYIDASWDNDCIPQLKPYIRQCLFICWMMVVQSPPMSLHVVEDGTQFDKTHFKEYTKTGPMVEYVVWPCMLIQKEGPVISKGVAQGLKDKVAARASLVSHDK